MKRFGFLTTIATLGLAASLFADSTSFETYTLDRGVALEGEDADMSAADARLATFMPDGTGTVSMTFDAHIAALGVNGQRATKGSFSIVSRTMGKATMSIELYNYDQRRWERMYSKAASNSDSRVVTVEFKNPHNYSCSMGSCKVKARVIWTGVRTRGIFKSASVDYVEWDITNQP